jgi:hypothetical protein
MEIIDDYLPEEDFKALEDVLMDITFPWFFSDSILGSVYSPNDYQLTNIIYLNQNGPVQHDVWEPIQTVIKKINPIAICRIKANLNPIYTKILEGGFHKDMSSNKFTSSILYMNTNNGYTKFESSGKEVKSIRNRLLTFPSTNIHTGSTCTDQKRRVVINFIYVK